MKRAFVLLLAISAALLSACSSETETTEAELTSATVNTADTQHIADENAAEVSAGSCSGYFLQTINGSFLIVDTGEKLFTINEPIRIEPADDTVTFDDLKTGDRISAGIKTITANIDSEFRSMPVHSVELLESGDVSYIDMSVIKMLKEQDIALRYASPEEIRQIIDRSGYPEIIITEDLTPEEILLAGKKAGKFFASSSEKYFEYGVNIEWKYDLKDDSNYISLGPYTDREYGIYAPMTGEEQKQFLMDYIRLTEKGYEELCLNSPSRYEINNGEFYVYSGDGGQAGWDFSRIVSYELGENELGEKTVTYNCERVGTAENWGYDEDMIKPFTFRLAFEDGIWKLDGVSYGEGFFELMWLESDIDAYFIPVEEQPANMEVN